MKLPIKLQVNGLAYEVLVEPHWTLLDVLRNQLGLTGAKKGCDSGECCACTVILAGRPVLSCLILAIQAQDKEILTIEGLSRDGELDRVQDAFVRCGAIQCGFCTPGMILTAYALLEKSPHPSTQEIKRALSGNMCRCTGYVKIIEAVEKAANVEVQK